MTKNDIISLAWKGSHMTNHYHNLKHCVDVYEWCEKILQFEHAEMSLDLKFATIFHDYNHSGGYFNDNYNIPEAIRFIVDNAHVIDNAGGNAYNVVKLINITKFVDGIFPHEPTTLEEMAIRDADLMSSFLPLPDAITALTGLYHEIRINQPDLSTDEFWEGNVKFMNNAKFYTKYGQMMAEQLPERLELLKGNINAY